LTSALVSRLFWNPSCPCRRRLTAPLLWTTRRIRS